MTILVLKHGSFLCATKSHLILSFDRLGEVWSIHTKPLKGRSWQWRQFRCVLSAVVVTNRCRRVLGVACAWSVSKWTGPRLTTKSSFHQQNSWWLTSSRKLGDHILILRRRPSSVSSGTHHCHLSQAAHSTDQTLVALGQYPCLDSRWCLTFTEHWQQVTTRSL